MSPNVSGFLFPVSQTSGYLNLLANCIDNFTHGLAVAGSFLVSKKVGYSAQTCFNQLHSEEYVVCSLQKFSFLFNAEKRGWTFLKRNFRNFKMLIRFTPIEINSCLIIHAVGPEAEVLTLKFTVMKMYCNTAWLTENKTSEIYCSYGSEDTVCGFCAPLTTLV